MVKKIIRIPVEGPTSPIGAAAFIALTAYPKNTEIRKRDELIDAVKAFFVKRAVSHADKTGKMIPVRPDLLKMSNEKIDNVFHQAALRLLTRRFLAVEMAVPIMCRDTSIKFVVGGKRPGVNVMANYMAKRLNAAKDIPYQRTQMTGKRVTTYIWSESKPVLHLALVLKGRMLEWNMDAYDWPDLLSNTDQWLRKDVLSAELYRKFLASQSELNIDVKQTFSLLPK